MAADPVEVDEPVRKLRRMESSDVKDGSCAGEQMKRAADALHEALERAAPAADDSCAVILFDGRAKDASDELIAELRAHAPSCSVPVAMIDMAQYECFKHSSTPSTVSTREGRDSPIPHSSGTGPCAVPPTTPLVPEHPSLADDIQADDMDDLPRLLVFFRDATTGRLRKMLSKPLDGCAGIAMSSLVVKPVFSLRHMARIIQRSRSKNDLQVARDNLASASEAQRSFSLMWMSASWCPPCQRILSCLPGMVPKFPESITNFFKADMDLTKPIFDAFHVEIIPTFVILDNEKIRREGAALEIDDKDLAALLVGAKVAELQNSQQATVMTFLEKHCSQLTFGDADDF